MNFDKTAFNSVYEDLIFNDNEDFGNAIGADDLIRLGWLLGQSSIALDHPIETTCAIHEDNLQKFVLDKRLKPSFNSEGFCGNFSLSVNDFEKYLQLPCRGEFLDCENEKITKDEIDALLLRTDAQTGQNNKRSFSDASSSSEPVKKFVFRQTNVGSNNLAPASSSTSTDSDRTDQDASRMTDGGKRVLLGKLPILNDRLRATNQPPEQQGERSFLPSSSSNTPLFSYDRTKKSNEYDTSRDKNSFITAREELLRQQALKKVGQNSNARPTTESTTPLFAYGMSSKTLGTRRSVHSKFVPPITPMEQPNNVEQPNADGDNDIDPRLKNIEPKMIELIQNEIMHQSSSVDWDDIAGLEYAKRTIQEAVIYPLLRPDIFTGLRGPPRGILLFGPPGTGKTLIGRCIASRSRSTFFSISASSLTSKWIGEGEKMVRALFAVASVNQPAVIFIDEIDSLLSQRSDTEHESSRRLKTEFLVQLDGARTTEDERILIVGATNRPQELDEAARRRLTKRLYIPLPELDARIQILTLLLQKEPNQISEQEIVEIGRLTDGFSGADMKTLCHEALMGPIRSIRLEDMESIDVNDVPRVNFVDFTNALKRVRASVSKDDLIQYDKWDSTYGLGAAAGK